MPHIILETTSDLRENADIPQILEALVECLSAQATVDPSAIKAYHGLRHTWVMGEGAPPGFAHCTVKLLTGRDEGLRSQIADAMYQTLCEQFAASRADDELCLTLELHEMNAVTYRK